MKKTIITMVAIGLFSSMSALADHIKDVAPLETVDTLVHKANDADCQKECDLLLNVCYQQVDTIHQRIERIKAAIKREGAKPEHAAELKILNKKLNDANETLRALEKPGH